jgi:hypothetical protein
MFTLRQASLIVLVAMLTGPVIAQTPQPLPKVGSCPTGYYPSGSYCMPNPNAAFAILKQGTCPTGFRPSSNYCLKN